MTDKKLSNKNEIQEEGTSVPKVEEQDIDYNVVNVGPLYLEERHKQPGYQYVFVADRPGEIATYQKLGYNVVIDEFNVGSDRAATTSRFGSAVTVQSRCGTLLVLMSITDKLHAKFEEHKLKKNLNRRQAIEQAKIQGVSSEYQVDNNGRALGQHKVERLK